MFGVAVSSPYLPLGNALQPNEPKLKNQYCIWIDHSENFEGRTFKYANSVDVMGPAPYLTTYINSINKGIKGINSTHIFITFCYAMWTVDFRVVSGNRITRFYCC